MSEDTTTPQKPDTKDTWGIRICLLFLSLFALAYGVPWTGKQLNASADNIGRACLVSWLVNMLVFAAIAVFLGKKISGRYAGVFIDERKQMSLSRMQMALWTVLLLSAWLTSVVSNYATGKKLSDSKPSAQPLHVTTTPSTLALSPKAANPGDRVSLTGTGFGAAKGSQNLNIEGIAVGASDIKSWSDTQIDFILPTREWTVNQEVRVGVTVNDSSTANSETTLVVLSSTPNAVSSALDVAIPSELWGALGISLVSLVGSPLVLSKKRGQTASKAKVDDMIFELAEKDRLDDKSKPTAEGVLVVKDHSDDARFVDMFRGDEVSNSTYFDLSKVQMFFFTLALVFAYAVAIGEMFLRAKGGMITSLPALSAGFVALLGLSHAGYLANKAVPRGSGSELPPVETPPVETPPVETPPNEALNEPEDPIALATLEASTESELTASGEIVSEPSNDASGDISPQLTSFGGAGASPQITFGTNAKQSALTSYSRSVLIDILRVANVPQVVISSTSRTPSEQARVMYHNLEQFGVAHQKKLYAADGDSVIEVYQQAKSASKTMEQILALMTAQIVKIGPTHVSRHASDPKVLNVFDIAPSSVSQKDAFITAVKSEKRVAKFLMPPKDPGFHLEIPQPPQNLV